MNTKILYRILGKFSKLNDETADIEPFIGELPTYLKEE